MPDKPTTPVRKPKPPWFEPLVGGVVFLITAAVGRVLLPETVGTFAVTFPMRIFCGVTAGATVSLALLMWRHRARPAGRLGLVAIGTVVCLVPAWLFMDRLTSYWVYGDDWEYVVSSRTLPRTIANLFVPHNVHVVPVWRIVTWVVVASGSGLADVQGRLAAAAYACLAVTMIAAGRFAYRETRSTTMGMTAAILTGTTAVMQSASVWYSASQALAAAIGILFMLGYLHSWRKYGGALRLGLAVLCVALSGWSWTVGYAAGPVGAAYLLADGRKRCVRAALLIFLSAGLIGGLTLKLSGSAIQEQSTISFHGRKTTDAITPSSAVFHTIQAIPERLILGDLGTVGEWNLNQATMLVLAIGIVWYSSRGRSFRITPLEAAGLALLVSSYGIEWVFRGYLPWTSLRGFVPWYDAIPQVGLSLFIVGWWNAVRLRRGEPVRTLTWGTALSLMGLQLMLATVALPRSDAQFLKQLRVLEPAEIKTFPIPRLQRLWGVYVATDRAERQARMLARIDRAQALARSRGLGREQLRAPLGRSVWPEPPVIDDVDLMDLPDKGTFEGDPAALRALFAGAFVMETEPRPSWIPPTDPWNPKETQ